MERIVVNVLCWTAPLLGMSVRFFAVFNSLSPFSPHPAFGQSDRASIVVGQSPVGGVLVGWARAFGPKQRLKPRTLSETETKVIFIVDSLREIGVWGTLLACFQGPWGNLTRILLWNDAGVNRKINAAQGAL